MPTKEYKQEPLDGEIFDVTSPDALEVPATEEEIVSDSVPVGAMMTYSATPTMSSDDILIPRLRLAQGLTSEVQEGVAKPGDYVLTGFPANKELTIVPMMFTRNRIYLDDERQVVCKSDDGVWGNGDPVGDGNGKWECAKCPLSEWSGPKDNRVAPVCTFGYSYLVYIKEHDTTAVIDFKRTSINVGKQLNTIAASKGGFGKFAVKLISKASESRKGKYFSP
jgi:hypothetical protein